jgi:tetratricopeptide (TPR) repeat protein
MIDVRDDDKVTDMGLLHGLGREPNTVLVSAMRLQRWLLSAALGGLVGCQAAGPTGPTPPVAVPTVAPVTVPTVAPVAVATVAPVAVATVAPVSTTPPPPASASRIEALNAANAAFRSGDLKTAAGFYDRVVNTPPNPAEAPAASAAINDFARFRGMVTLLADGREDEARIDLQELQKRDPSSPLARLGSQLYDQYGMTGQLRGACAQLQPQLASQAGPTLATLQGLGVAIDAQSLCSIP